MTYMWPNYFSLGQVASVGHGYDLYLYKEGQHSFTDARKVDVLSCSNRLHTAMTDYSGAMFTLSSRCCIVSSYWMAIAVCARK